MENAQFFHYKTQKTFLHRLPAPLKIVLILFLALLAFYLPVKVCFIAFALLILLSFFLLHFTLSEIISDLKPSLVYVFLLYIATMLLNLANYIQLYNSTDFNKSLLYAVIYIIKPNLTYLPMLAHLSLSLEITAIFYRTTSISQFKEGFSSIEAFIRRKDYTPLSDILSLALSFIPRISTFWGRLEKAWLCRGGKASITKALYLFPKLFHVSMREGYEKSLAIQNRS